MGSRLELNYGFRSRAQQQALYDLYVAGKGAPANKPDTSMHEKGLAADVNDLGVNSNLLADLSN